MAQAILLGIRSAMPTELVRAFRETGTSHLLAISGLHVGVFLALSLALSRWALGARGQAYVLAPLAAVWLYALLSGMSPSVQRAAIMGSVYLAGLYLGRQNSGMPALAAAAALMVGLEPEILTRVSFQLSFAAMAGLVLLAPPIESRLLQAAPGLQERPWSRELTYAFAASVAATLATLPLVAYYFNYVSLVSLPATILAMPAMPFVLGTSLLTAALGLLDPGVAKPMGWIAWLCLTYLKQVVELFDAIPGSAVRVGWMGAPLVVAYYAAMIGAVFLRPVSRMFRSAPSQAELQAMPGAEPGGPGRLGGMALWAIVAIALLGAAAAWTAVVERPDGKLHVTFLDVGQGDSIFIVTPGGRQVLVDGGPDPKRLLNLLGERVPFWDRSLDLVVLTHPHSDHAAGLAEALRRYDAELVLEREVDHSASEYASWRAAVKARAGRVVQAQAGQRILLDRGLALEVLYPPERMLAGTSSDLNNASVVTRLVYGETSFLLAGDIHWDVERYMLRRAVHLDSTVLKVGHQGSRTSTTPEFLEEVSPQVAVISVGADNRFGHPHDEVMQSLTDALGEDRVFLTKRPRQHRDCVGRFEPERVQTERHGYTVELGAKRVLYLADRKEEKPHRMFRVDGRANDQPREVRITPSYLAFPEGSALIEVGETRVICTASVEERVPPFLRGQGRGWVTAEYGMLPRSTLTRRAREREAGRVDGRTQEIQRLIGRSLRAVVEMKGLGERTVTIDCDVLQADGGTRTAAITGAYIALYQAIAYLVKTGAIPSVPLTSAPWPPRASGLWTARPSWTSATTRTPARTWTSTWS